jgi:hypothetical protein
MKKFFTILALVFVVALTFSACTEEEVTPTGGNSSGSEGSVKGF